MDSSAFNAGGKPHFLPYQGMASVMISNHLRRQSAFPPARPSLSFPPKSFTSPWPVPFKHWGDLARQQAQRLRQSLQIGCAGLSPETNPVKLVRKQGMTSPAAHMKALAEEIQTWLAQPPEARPPRLEVRFEQPEPVDLDTVWAHLASHRSKPPAYLWMAPQPWKGHIQKLIQDPPHIPPSVDPQYPNVLAFTVDAQDPRNSDERLQPFVVLMLRFSARMGAAYQKPERPSA